MSKIYLDIESGTWFWCPPVTIETEEWTEADWEAWDNKMSDADRCAWGEQYNISQLDSPGPKPPLPADYCEISFD